MTTCQLAGDLAARQRCLATVKRQHRTNIKDNMLMRTLAYINRDRSSSF